MQRVLVTGATGFVGREVVRQLTEAGHEVIGLCRTASASTDFIVVDICDREALEGALSALTFDCVMHVASLPGDTGDPSQMTRVNVLGCQNVLELARHRGVDRFVLASSISAYEWYPETRFVDPDYLPVDEMHPCRPKDMYSTSKRIQELLTLTYFRQYDLPAVVLRLTAVVGPDGRGGGRGWREFAAMLAGGGSVQVPFFSPDELCHFVDLRDVARMFTVAATHPQAIGEVFNCCGPSPTRGEEFARLVGEVCRTCTVEYGFPWSMAQGKQLAFDISKARRLIDFEPLYSVRDTLRSIHTWIEAGGLADGGAPGPLGLARGIISE